MSLLLSVPSDKYCHTPPVLEVYLPITQDDIEQIASFQMAYPRALTPQNNLEKHRC